MAERITEREAARRMGVSHASIAYQRHRGNFAFDNDRLLDWDEVKANYQTQRPAQNPEATRREQHAKITTTVVKANFAKVQLARLERNYIDPSLPHDAVLAEMTSLLAGLEQLPAQAASTLTSDFDLTEHEAETIVAEVVKLTLGELGDLVAQAEHLFESG